MIDTRWMVLCERFREHDGLIDMLNVFPDELAPNGPYPLVLNVAICAALRYEPADVGPHHLAVAIRDDDAALQFRSDPAPIQLMPRTDGNWPGGWRLQINPMPLRFTKPAGYVVELEIDERVVGEATFRVTEPHRAGT